MRGSLIAALLIPGLAAPLLGAPAAQNALLPPVQPWHGASEALIAPAGDPWITPAETSGLATTPRYDETMRYLERLAAASPLVRVVSIGTSPEGRAIRMVIVSREGAATPGALAANGRPTLLAQAGIHAGEIDGKDAGLMLLRDLTVRGSKRALLERSNFLFVPIFNVDGHERSSAFTRINQRGPAEAGWRTNATNLNLNRDYAKLDTPEVRAMVGAIVAWRPDLYVDLHVTDGADYQNDITYGWSGASGWSPAIARWLDGAFRPAVDRDLAASGHHPGPFVNYVDPLAPAKGLVEWQAPARFSNGYGDLRHLPSILVENHSLKPYRQRVLGTYVLLESALRVLGAEGASLRAAVAADRDRRADPLPLDWKPGGAPRAVELAAIAAEVRASEVTGGPVVEWTGRPTTQRLPLTLFDTPSRAVDRPRAYWIPPGYPELIDRLREHGVEIERIAAARELDVEAYRLSEAKLAAEPFEGRVAVTARATPERRRERLPAGSVRVATDQPLGDLAIVLLEPDSPDSFFQWGFLLACLQRTEYAESYILEPMARRMLAEDPALRAEFEKKLAADAAFAADPEARLDWFYRRTPFFDERAGLYPIYREP